MNNLQLCFSVLLVTAALVVDATTFNEMHDILGSLDFSSFNCPPLFIANGRAKMRSHGRVVKFNCRSGFQLVGKQFSTCIRGRWNTLPPICVSRGCETLLAPVNGQIRSTDGRGALYSFACDAGYQLVGSATLFCNRASWNGTVPNCIPFEMEPSESCDFEDVKNLCGWTQEKFGDHFDWLVTNLKTPSGYWETGPSYDHTLGKYMLGHYMFIEASAPRRENDTARLVSPVYVTKQNSSRADELMCFQMWYHMYGTSTGVLRVFLKIGNDLTQVWSAVGNKGDQWLLAVMSLQVEIGQNFQLVIEAVRGNGYAGDIAIDDVSLQWGENCTVAADNDTSSDVTTPETELEPFTELAATASTSYEKFPTTPQIQPQQSNNTSPPSTSTTTTTSTTKTTPSTVPTTTTTPTTTKTTTTPPKTSTTTTATTTRTSTTTSVPVTTTTPKTTTTTTTTTTPKPSTTTSKPTTTPKPTTTTSKATSTTPKPTTTTTKQTTTPKTTTKATTTTKLTTRVSSTTTTRAPTTVTPKWITVKPTTIKPITTSVKVTTTKQPTTTTFRTVGTTPKTTKTSVTTVKTTTKRFTLSTVTWKVVTSKRTLLPTKPTTTVSRPTTSAVSSTTTQFVEKGKKPALPPWVYMRTSSTTESEHEMDNELQPLAQTAGGVLGTAAAAGIAVVTVVVVALLVAVAFNIYRRHFRRAQDALNEDSDVRFLKDGEVRVEFVDRDMRDSQLNLNFAQQIY